MKTQKQDAGHSQTEAGFPTYKRRTKRNSIDPNQMEFGIIWKQSHEAFRLRAGVVVMINNRLCHIVCVNECAAVVIMNRPLREFKTRFDKPVNFQPPPAMYRISPHSEIPILNRKMHKK
jgi:hypothetical protein